MADDIEEITKWEQLPPHMVKHTDEFEANMATQLYTSFKCFEAIMKEHHQPKPFFIETYQKANEADKLLYNNGNYSNEVSVRADLPNNEEMGSAWSHWATMKQKNLLDYDKNIAVDNRYGEERVDTALGHVLHNIEADIVLQRFFLVDCDEAIRNGDITYPEFQQKFIDNFIEQEGDEGRDLIDGARVLLNNFMGDHAGGIYSGFENIGKDSKPLLQAWYVHARAEIVISQQQELMAQMQADSSDKPIETSSVNPVDIENVGEKDKTVLAASN